MSGIRVARRYAKGLLAVAVEERKIADYGRELEAVAGLLTGHAELRNVVTNPLHDRSSRRAILDILIKKLSTSPVMSQFLRLALDKGRLRHLPAIASAYQRLVDDHTNVGRATVSAAVSIPPAAQSRIKDALESATGKTIILTVNQDPGLIGGIKAKIGDLVLDGSIKTQLEGLKNSLKRGEAV
ncbi:MAG: ATP synthase F1 subunit delta [Pseudomonadota bacterium]